MRIGNIVIFFVFLLAGCLKGQKSFTTTTIEIKNVADSISFDSIIKDYQYIELSQENGFVLGEIDQIIIDDDRVYVSSDGVYCFDMKGKPLFKVTKKGRARNEFTECTSISVNKGMIYLYDVNAQLIHRYNSKDGTFVDNISVPVISRDIYKIDNGYVIDHLFPTDFYKGEARILTTRDFNSPNGEYLMGKQYHYMPREGQVTYCGKSVLFADYEGHSIFSFSLDGCKEYDVLCKDVEMIPQDILDKRGIQSIDGIDDHYTYGLSKVYENDTHLLGTYQWGTPLKFIYNKKTNTAVAFLHYDESDYYRVFPYNICGVYKDYFIYVISSEDYDFLKEAYGFGTILPDTHPEYNRQKILKEHDVDGNPIVALYKFKDF